METPPATGEPLPEMESSDRRFHPPLRAALPISLRAVIKNGHSLSFALKRVICASARHMR